MIGSSLEEISLPGPLFSTQIETVLKVRFFVFLRTCGMRASRFEDLRFATKGALAAAKVDDGWPVLEPRLIR